MDLMALLLSFAAGGVFAAVGICCIRTRSAPHMNGDIIERMRRETDESPPVDGGLLMRDPDRELH